MKLLNTDRLEQAMTKLYDAYTESIGGCETETAPVREALGRILAEDVISGEDVPGFDRSTVDGYAVMSRDTSGATESVPAFLKVKGEVEMGRSAGVISAGECTYVPTGGMLPAGADSVVMVEYTEAFSSESIAAYASLSPGRNIIKTGDDFRAGEILLRAGRRLRPADLGLLSAAGVTSVKVFRPWKVSVISTGDEIVDPAESPAPGQVRDVNSAALAGAVMEAGLNLNSVRLIRDNEEELREALFREMEISDLVIISGGSSQGKKDVSEKLIDFVCSSGVLTHGVSVKPGKPTITGVDSKTRTAVIGLPGHPQAALVLFREVPLKLWYMVTGAEEETAPAITGIMTENAAAAPGRRTFLPVTLESISGETAVTPIHGQSGLISRLSRAQGYVVIGEDDEGLNRGDKVKVYLF